MSVGLHKRPVLIPPRLRGLALAILLPACSGFQPGGPVDLQDNDMRTQSRQGVTVTTTLLTDEQALEVYGVDLADVGLQAVWLRIQNDTDHHHWLLAPALDSNYFAPAEAAELFHIRLVGEDEERVTQHFRNKAMPLKSPAGGVTEGFILAPHHEGGRYLSVTLAGEGHALRYDFTVTLPDGEFDFERLQPELIYAGKDRPDLDVPELHDALLELRCCTLDEDGVANGDPLNLVLVGSLGDLLGSLARAGWSYTHMIDLKSARRMVGAAISGGAYAVAPVSPLYLYGRPQDIAFQRARNTVFQRNHVRVWLAPFRFQGKSVWVGQVSRDIGVKPTSRSPTFVTHVIDANVDESREHLFQSLLVAGVVERFAFVGGVPLSTAERPANNLTEDPYFTDGLRLVVELSANTTTSLDDIVSLDWEVSEDPILEAMRESACGLDGEAGQCPQHHSGPGELGL